MKTFYQTARTGKIQQWAIWVEESGKSGFPEVWIEFGLQDGKKQRTHDVIKEGVNLGRSNETTAIEQAYLVAERKAVKQLEHGYVENIKDLKSKNGLDLSQPFPKNLCFYKPKNSISENKISELEKNKRAIYTIKRDGMMHVIKKFNNNIDIYSRRMDLVTEKYPHLIESLATLPWKDFVLLGEIVLEHNGKDNFNAVSKICRSDPEKAIERQKELGLVSYYVFVMVWADGNNLLSSVGFKDRLDLLKKINVPYIIPVEVISKPHEQALQETKDRGLEGLVVWDSENIMPDDQAFTLNGKAYRPNVVWKSKPKYEDDFIVDFNPSKNIGDYGKGKNKDKLGNVFLYQIDEHGDCVYLGKCGGGLTDAQRDYYTTASFPRCWRVEYDSIQPNTGSLRFPVFAGDRTEVKDKDISECLLSETIKQAREMDD